MAQRWFDQPSASKVPKGDASIWVQGSELGHGLAVGGDNYSVAIAGLAKLSCQVAS